MKLVLLPGLDGTGIMFEPLVREFDGQCALQVVSYPQDPRLGYKELTELVQNQIPRDEFFILGESFSGPIALRVASRKPKGLLGLILCATFVTNPNPLFPSSLAFLAIPPMFAVWPVSAKMHILATSQPNDELRWLMMRVKKATPAAVLASRTREALRINVVTELKECTYPILYLAGDRDLVVPKRNVKIIAAVQPKVKIRNLPTSHLVLQEAPREAMRTIMNFIEETSQQGVVADGSRLRLGPLKLSSV